MLDIGKALAGVPFMDEKGQLPGECITPFSEMIKGIVNECKREQNDKESSGRMGMNDIEEVVPELERIPKRKYERDGQTIICYGVEKHIAGIDPVITFNPEPLFEFTLTNEEYAKMLMNDLYYGEYTGG